MNIIRFLYFIATIVEVAKSSAEADDVSLLAQRLFKAKHLLRGSGLNNEKETGPKRILEAGTKRLLQLISINLECDDDEESNDVESNDDDEISNPPSMYPSHPPSITKYEEKKLVASDGRSNDMFGGSCSISKDLVLIGAKGVDGENNDEGAAYLFHLDGIEVAKLTPGDDGEDDNEFGNSVSIDEKVVVGTNEWRGGYVRVFSREGIYERKITCDGCNWFGNKVATLGNLIVTKGKQNSINKLFIYSNEDGQLMKVFELEDVIWGVGISEKYIEATSLTGGKTLIYSNTLPEFPKVAEINQGGTNVAASNDRIVIGNGYANNYDGAVWLYNTDGTLVTALDRQDASSGSLFGWSVAITNDKVIVGADNDQGSRSGSVFIYSSDTGEFLEKVLASDGEDYDRFGDSLCASDSHYVVGAIGDDDYTGAAYLFQFSE